MRTSGTEPKTHEILNKKLIHWKQLEQSDALSLKLHMTADLHHQLFANIEELSAGAPCRINLGALEEQMVRPVLDIEGDYLGKRDLLISRRALVTVAEPVEDLR